MDNTTFEVLVTGKGTVRGEEMKLDPATKAHCSACKQDVELVVEVIDSVVICKNCLRARLDATSVATWRLAQQGKAPGLPWGKVAG